MLDQTVTSYEESQINRSKEKLLGYSGDKTIDRHNNLQEIDKHPSLNDQMVR
jgi:hypothetical protein